MLAHRRGARMVRTRVEVQEQTEVGDALVRGLVRAQLGPGAAPGGRRVCTVVAIPLLGQRLSRAGGTDRVRYAGSTGSSSRVLVYPVFYGVGRLYVRLAEQARARFRRRRR